MITTNPDAPSAPIAESSTAGRHFASPWTWLEKARAFLQDTNRIRIAILASLLVWGGLWFSMSLVDRLSGTGYLNKSGLVLISGPPVTTGVAFLFYLASLLALALVTAVPSFRRGFLKIAALAPGPLDHPRGLLKRFRAFLPFRGVEWLAVLASNIGILGLRFFLFPFPQGSDTPQYLQAANSLFFEGDLGRLSEVWGVGVGRWLTVLALTGLRVVLLPVPGQPELLTVMVAPVILGVFYSISICLFIHSLMRDRRLAVWGAIIAPISFLTIDLSYNLFAQFLGQALCVLALAGFTRFLLQGSGRALPAAALYVAALLAHMWTWAIFAIISCVILGWALAADSSGRKEKFRRAVWVLGPSVVLMGLLTVALLSVRFAAFYAYSVGAAQPFSLPEGWLWIGGWESAIVWGLGLLGIVVLASRQIESIVRAPLLLWTATVSATVFVTGFTDSYRFLLMYPMPILVVIGMKYLSDRLRIRLPRLGPRDVRAHLARGVPAVALVLILLGSVLPWTYIAEWQYWPGDATYRQLVQIRDHYGFGNRSILILIDQRYYESASLWTSAVTGAEVFPGNLLSLLRGDPYRRELHRWIYPDLNGVTEILVPSTLYSPDSLETSLLSTGKVSGVPSYRVAGTFNVTSFLTAAALPLSNSFWMNWTLESSTLNATLSNGSSRVNWTLRAQPSNEKTRWASYLRPLPNRTAESLYFLVSGSLNGAGGSVEVDYLSGNVTTYALDRILPDPLLIRMRLSGSEVPKLVKVTFWVAEGKASLAGWTQCSYMGLVTP